jgi:hypothetical protein
MKKFVYGLLVWLVLVGVGHRSVAYGETYEEERLLKVESKVFKLVMYSSETRMLSVVFQNGRVYEYFEIPKTVFEGLMRSQHKGGYYNRQIKSRFKYRRVL